MTLKHILSLTALCGALGTAQVASADHDRDDRRVYRAKYRDVDVIGTARLHDQRGVVTFKVTPKMRRDGLALHSRSRGLRLLAVELEYSDGRVEELRGRELRFALNQDPWVVIQRGRPPGLRFVHVRYALGRRANNANLRLVQIHTGDGYTSEEDLRHDRDGRYEYDRDAYRR